MSKELKIKGALSKDFQQIYIEDEPTGLFINNEGAIKSKSLKNDTSDEIFTIRGKVNIEHEDSLTINSSGGTTTFNSAGDIVAFRDLKSGRTVYSEGDVILDPAGTVYFDGGAHTYISEVSADVLDIFVGGDRMGRLDEANDRITLSTGKNVAALADGTEYSATDSAYAGMILGYTHLAPVINESVTLGTSYAVVDADAKVTFVAPPSGNVEIEIYFYRDSLSTNKTLYVALSDNATFNQASAELGDGSTAWDLLYDYGFNFADETDDITLTAKFVAGGLTAGNSYTYWFGAKTSATNTYIKYGGRTLTDPDRFYPPIIMKATALPASIHTDS